MNTFWYSVGSRRYSFNTCEHISITTDNLFRIAQLAARHYYSRHLGEPIKWPVVFAIHPGEDCGEIARYSVSLEMTPAFAPEAL